ncbi:hypothetical protein G9A89_017609 [Geosiphon pyriformis]|nr:hypothetical protein G9A89_017609 [Geosiphon pyriformis]
MVMLNGQRPKITSPLISSCIAELAEKCWDVNPENLPNACPEIEQFLESDKYVEEMADGDDLMTTTAITRIHPGAVYTSRLLTLQMIDFSKG